MYDIDVFLLVTFNPNLRHLSSVKVKLFTAEMVEFHDLRLECF